MVFYETKHKNSPDYCALERHINIDFPLHYHKNFEIIYCFDGNISMIIDNRHYDLTKGQTCVVLPNQTHSLFTVGNSDCFIGIFSTHYVPDGYEDFAEVDCDAHVFDMDITSHIDSFYKNKSDKYLCTAAICDIFSHFTRLNNFRKRNNQQSSLIQNTIDYIEKNFDKTPSLVELANSLGYSSHYLSNIFAAYFGKNFSQVVNRYRVEKAIELLKDGAISVTSTATACGFGSIRNFNRQFLAATGQTPAEFRKSL